MAKAEAEAKASIILAKADIHKHELAMRAAHRFARIETRRQENIESIANKAIAELPPAVSKEPVSEDWTAQFFDCCQDVGEGEMQRIWGKILAGEVAEPGRFGRRTLQVLKTLSTFEAQTFTAFCSAAFTEGGHLHFLFPGDSLKTAMAKFSGLEAHLSDIGLLGQPGMRDLWDLDGMKIEFFGRRYRFIVKKRDALPDRIQFPGPPIFLQYFSEVGNELASIAKPIEWPDLLNLIEKEWAEQEVKFIPIGEDEAWEPES